jgi:transposase-like protein
MLTGMIHKSRQGGDMPIQLQGRALTARQKLDLVVALMRGDQDVNEISADSGVDAETLNHWRDQVIAGGLDALMRCHPETVTEFEGAALKRQGRWWDVT